MGVLLYNFEMYHICFISGMAIAENPMETPMRMVPRYRVNIAWSCLRTPGENTENMFNLQRRERNNERTKTEERPLQQVCPYLISYHREVIEVFTLLVRKI